jgi:hypothetical protein
MEIRTILALLGLLAAGAVVADAYTWTDDEGVVHYSDRPIPGATRIYISEPNSGRSPAPRRNAARAGDSDPETTTEPADTLRYSSFEVTAPGAEETLWNIEGVLNVSLSLTPALQPGHQIRVYFNGDTRMVSGMSFQIDEVHRGVHNLQAEVLDPTGKMLIRTRTNRFYVQQSTVR